MKRKTEREREKTKEQPREREREKASVAREFLRRNNLLIPRRRPTSTTAGAPFGLSLFYSLPPIVLHGTCFRHFATLYAKDQLLTYEDPWQRPNIGKFVTHFSAIESMKYQVGGMTTYVTRDENGVVVDDGFYWVPGEKKIWKLHLHAMLNYSSTKPIVSPQIICTDCDGLLFMLRHVSNGGGCDDEKIYKMACDLLKNLEINFSPDTVVNWVPEKANNLAKAYCLFRLWKYIDEVSTLE